LIPGPFIVSGILIAFLVGYWLAPSGNWRGMFAGALVPAVILLAGLTLLPETPRWLLKAGREACGRKRQEGAEPSSGIGLWHVPSIF